MKLKKLLLASLIASTMIPTSLFASDYEDYLERRHDRLVDTHRYHVMQGVDRLDAKANGYRDPLGVAYRRAKRHHNYREYIKDKYDLGGKRYNRDDDDWRKDQRKKYKKYKKWRKKYILRDIDD